MSNTIITFYGLNGASVNLQMNARFRVDDHYEEWLTKTQSTKCRRIGVSPETDSNIKELKYNADGQGMAYIKYYGI